jgi:hypothetical protein
MDTAMAASNDTSPSGLVSIPAEMLLQITSYLTTPELGNVRLTCKSIEESLLASFTREFFTKRQFTFTEFSLQALFDISRSRFSTTLTHVLFGIEKASLERVAQSGSYANTRSERAQANRRLEGYVSHLAFMNTGQDFEILSEAFSNLQNLEVVGMRDFYSRSRTRDWPFVEWRSKSALIWAINSDSGV